MDISDKRKRINNDNDDDDDMEEAEIEKFSEILEKFRIPYNWFRAKMSCSGSAIDSFCTAKNNGDDWKKKKKKKKKKKIIVEDGSKSGHVWKPCFLLEDFEEEKVIKFGKSETTAPAPATTDRIDVGGEEKENMNNHELDLRLSL